MSIGQSQRVEGEGARQTRAGSAATSALWAAWADAVGWISELTDEKGLDRRLRGRELGAVPWRRRMGGRGGVDVDLPAGAWSDDTQLRLAVGRCLSARGFDVEAFSRVELPVWRAYAFGGGFATKAAASVMAKPGARWSVNTSSGYWDAGGNGAAMRIQPHAWRHRQDSGDATLLLDVLRDAVTTHGHPRAILGAALHALCVIDLMPDGNRSLLKGVASWTSLLDRVSLVSDLAADDSELSALWLPQWSHAEYSSWGKAAGATLIEMQSEAERVAAVVEKAPNFEAGYVAVVDLLDLRDAKQRGSGSRTSLAALALLALARRHDRASASVLIAAASVVETDTDTIATMAGALLGLLETDGPPGPVLDEQYLVAEARRIADADGPGEAPVRYPDLLNWDPPRTQADALLEQLGENERLLVAGLGSAVPLGQPIVAARGDFAWQWVRLEFGQTVLIKRRPKLARANLASRSAPAPAVGAQQQGGDEPSDQEPTLVEAQDSATARHDRQLDHPGQDASVTVTTAQRADAAAQKPAQGVPARRGEPADVAQALADAHTRVRSSSYDTRQIGLMLVRLATDLGPEVASVFGAMVAGDIARMRRPHSS